MVFLIDPAKPTKEVCLFDCKYYCRIKPLYGIDPD